MARANAEINLRNGGSADGEKEPLLPICAPALSQAILSEVLGRGLRAQWPGYCVRGTRPRARDIGLFLVARPFRLDHLEISFGICYKRENPGRRRNPAKRPKYRELFAPGPRDAD
jgi:hypothetical protein